MVKKYNKLTPEDTQILDLIQQGSNKEGATVVRLIEELRKIKGKEPDIDEIVEKLEEAVKVGLVKRDIINKQDEPVMVWKSQIRL